MKFELIEQNEQVIYGCISSANDKTIASDIQRLSKEYATKSNRDKEVFPYYVLSCNYNLTTKDSELWIGSVKEAPALQRLTIAAGLFAKITIKPKLGFMWGLAVGEAKRKFYTEWLTQSDYLSLNLEYEFHTENSIAKHPTIDLYFAIKRKDSNHDHL